MKEAQFNLAKLLLSGEGINYDFDRAMENYKLAAEQGLLKHNLIWLKCITMDQATSKIISRLMHGIKNQPNKECMKQSLI